MVACTDVHGLTMLISARSRMSGMILSTAFHSTSPRSCLSRSYSGLPLSKPASYCIVLPQYRLLTAENGCEQECHGM